MFCCLVESANETINGKLSELLIGYEVWHCHLPFHGREAWHRLTEQEKPVDYRPAFLLTIRLPNVLPYLLIFAKSLFFGVADGTRTRDNWNHNPGLYQLSYGHHWCCQHC